MTSLAPTASKTITSQYAVPLALQLRSWLLRIIGAIACIGLLVGVQYVLPHNRFTDPYVQQIIILAGVNIILAVSLNLINGITGQFSLGHAGFMAIGAYSAAYFTREIGSRSVLADWLVFIIALLIAALTAGLAGWLVGLPSLRLRGDYLAIVTLGFGQIIVVIIRTIEEIGGASGFNKVPKMTTLWGTYALVALCILCMRNIAVSNLGRSMRAVREDEVAAEAAGINTTRVKVTAFIISAMWAGIAGALQVHYIQLAHPNDFGFLRSVEVVVMVVLGGLGSITGVTITAVLLRVLEELLRSVSMAFWIGLALVAFAAILSFPRHRPAMRRNKVWGVFGWLIWPLLCTIALIILFQSPKIRPWLEDQVSALRYIIYSLILIVLMLLRPQGLLGRGELGWALFRGRWVRNRDETNVQDIDEPKEQEVSGTM
jgi:branched-chain amino acid transport system permease protein